MIIGDCPYEGCSGAHMIPCAPKCPAFSRQVCEECGRPFWLLHSRVDPKAFTEEEFAARYEVDEATKVITERTA